MMMSPLSVAQFLIPGKQKFDLLVMDEASQIQPIDAIGAIARSKQVVVVGDERQLPPTQFFAKMTAAANDEGDDDEISQVADIESILGLFVARGLRQRMLRWHYRSRHRINHHVVPERHDADKQPISKAVLCFPTSSEACY